MRNSSNNSKSEILKSMMRHPDMSRLIRDAVNSPLGSTNRTKARKTFSIMNKLHSSNYGFDGAGGPGYQDPMGMMPSPESMPMSMGAPEEDVPKNVVIFHRIPTPKINYSGKKASKNEQMSFDGAGGPGYFDGKGGIWDSIKSKANDWLTSDPIVYNASDYNQPTQGATSTLTANQNNDVLNAFATPFTASLQAPSSAMANAVKGMKLPEANAPIPLLNNNKATPTMNPNVQTPAYTPAYSMPIENTSSPLSKLTASFKNPIDSIKTLFNPQISPAYKESVQKLADQPMVSGVRDVSNPLTGFGQPDTIKERYQVENPLYGMNKPIDKSTPTSTESPSSIYPALSTKFETPPADTEIPTVESVPIYTESTQTPNTYANLVPTPTTSTQGYGSAALNLQSSMGGIDLANPLTIATQDPQILSGMIDGIIRNEGSSPAGVVNNPGNIKFNNLPGQINSGVQATDGGTFASYETPEAGREAIGNLIKVAASGRSPSYGTNPTLGSFMNTYTNTAPGGSYSGMQHDAQNAVNSSVGAGAYTFSNFRNPNDPVTGGLLPTERYAQNKKDIWSSFGLDDMKTNIEKMQKEFTALPKDMTDYINARDTYIKETNQAISDYTAKMEDMDMSNPIVADRAQSHLNYLYTLRGRQNQSYMGYLNDAVTQQETKLNNAITDYNAKLSLAEQELTSMNSITAEQYQMYATALTDLYNEVQDAPTRALEAQILQAQVYGAASTSAKDQAEYDAKLGYFAQRDKLKGSIIDNNLMAIPGTDLVETMYRNQQGNPSIDQGSQIRAYEEGVKKFMMAPNEEDPTKGSGVTAEGKKKLAEEAIRNFANVSAEGMLSGNYAAVNQGLESAMSIGTNLVSQIADSVTTIAPELITSVKTLAPRGLFGKKTPPTLEQFISTVKTNTGNNPLADSVAKAIYSVFLRYTAEPDSTPEGAVQTMLNQTSGTDDRANLVPYSPEQFSQIIGRMYVEDILMSEFSRSNELAQQMQNMLYTQ